MAKSYQIDINGFWQSRSTGLEYSIGSNLTHFHSFSHFSRIKKAEIGQPINWTLGLIPRSRVSLTAKNWVLCDIHSRLWSRRCANWRLLRRGFVRHALHETVCFRNLTTRGRKLKAIAAALRFRDFRPASNTKQRCGDSSWKSVKSTSSHSLSDKHLHNDEMSSSHQ